MQLKLTINNIFFNNGEKSCQSQQRSVYAKQLRRTLTSRGVDHFKNYVQKKSLYVAAWFERLPGPHHGTAIEVILRL